MCRFSQLPAHDLHDLHVRKVAAFTEQPLHPALFNLKLEGKQEKQTLRTECWGKMSLANERRFMTRRIENLCVMANFP